MIPPEERRRYTYARNNESVVVREVVIWVCMLEMYVRFRTIHGGEREKGKGEENLRVSMEICANNLSTQACALEYLCRLVSAS